MIDVLAYIKPILQNYNSMIGSAWKTLLLLSFLFPLDASLFCQSKRLISGVIIDKKSEEDLPYASISFKNAPSGTISNEMGDFSIIVPELLQNDTLVINYLGYEQYLIPVNSINTSLKIKLEPKTIELNEVVVQPLSPQVYLKRAIRRIRENYALDPFQTISFYKEELKKNNVLVKNQEAIIKSYYPEYHDSMHNQHQILLYRYQDGQCLKKTKAKQEDERNETEENIDIEMNLGGPETLLIFDLIKQKPAFLDTNQFKHFKYSFGERTVYQAKDLITINFHGKSKIDKNNIDEDMNQKLEGSILLDLDTYAIVSIDYHGKILIPVHYNAVVLMFGMNIKEPMYNQIVKYEQYKGKWYPKDFRLNRSVNITKTHLFRSNEHMDFAIDQIFYVSEVKVNNTLPIPKNKVFKPNEKMKSQVYNDEKIQWTDINVLKN